MKLSKLGLTIASVVVSSSMVLASCGPQDTGAPAEPTGTVSTEATATTTTGETGGVTDATPTTETGAAGAETPSTGAGAATATPATGGAGTGAGPERVPADQLPIAPPKGVTSSKDTLVFAMSQEPSSLFTLFETAAVAQTAGEPIFDGLINRDAKDNLYPEIAWYVPTLENGGAYGKDGSSVSAS